MEHYPIERFIAGAGMEARTETFCSENGWRAAIFLGEELVHRLRDDELRAVIGHELAHIKYKHHHLYICADLIDFSQKKPRLIAVKNLYEHWRQLAEISADRLSLLAVEQPESAVSALYKQRLRTLHGQFDIKAHLAAQKGFFNEGNFNELCSRSHPPLDFRARAILDFSASSFFQALMNDDESGDDDSLEKLRELTAKLKTAPDNQPVSLELLFLAVAGHYIVNCDGCAHHQEIRRLRDILARLIHDPGGMLNITDSPGNPSDMMNRIGWRIRENCPSIRSNILALLCSLVLQDGTITREEMRALDEIADSLGMSNREAAAVIFKTIRKDFYPVVR